MTWRTYAADEPRFLLPKNWLLIEGQRTNLLPNARTPGGVGWTVVEASVGTSVGPDGAAGSAGLLTETAATSGHYMGQTVTVAAGQTYAQSCLVLPGSGARFFQMHGAPGINNGYVNFDLTGAGSVATAVNCLAGITLVGGWFYCWMVFTAQAAGSNQVRFCFANSGSATRLPSYAGSGTATLAIWAPQFELGAFPSTPVMSATTGAATRSNDVVTAPFASIFPTGSGTLLVSAIFQNAAPLNANQTLLRCGDADGISGWDIVNERPSTNVVRNPRCEGAAPGTPGVLPTFFTIAALQGLSSEVVGVGTEDGLAYFDLRFFGTPTATGPIQVNPESTFAATDNQIWVMSLFTRLVGGSLTNVGLATLALTIGNGTTGGLNYTLTTDSLKATRRSVSALGAGGTTTGVARWRCNVTAGAPVDFTVRFAAPQVELGAVATSLMLPPVGTPGVSSRSGNRLMLTDGCNSVSLGEVTPGVVTKVAATFGGATIRALLDGGSVQAIPKPSGTMVNVRLGNNFAGDAAAFALFGGLFSRPMITPDGELPSSLSVLPT